MNVSDAFHKTVHSAVGGCEALAVRLGISAAVLRNKANPHLTANKPMLDDADRIMGITGDHQILHALAANHGFVCVRVPDDANSSDVAVLELVTKVWAMNGQVGAAVNDTLADGRVEPHEVERVREAVYRAQKALLEMVERLDGMSEKKNSL